MKIWKQAIGFLVAGILLAGMSLDARAGDPRFVKHGEPGSVLVFPFYATKDAQGTAMVVTNTNTDTTYVPGSDSRTGDVVAHYLYVDGDDWQVSYMPDGYADLIEECFVRHFDMSDGWHVDA